MKDENQDRLSYRIIGAAIEVHKLLGPGLLESVYETALCAEFKLRGISAGLLLNFNEATLSKGIKRVLL